MSSSTVIALPREDFAELVQLARTVAAELFEGVPVDWEELWVQLDGATLADGRRLNLDAPSSPVQDSIRWVLEQP